MYDDHLCCFHSLIMYSISTLFNIYFHISFALGASGKRKWISCGEGRDYIYRESALWRISTASHVGSIVSQVCSTACYVWSIAGHGAPLQATCAPLPVTCAPPLATWTRPDTTVSRVFLFHEDQIEVWKIQKTWGSGDCSMIKVLTM